MLSDNHVIITEFAIMRAESHDLIKPINRTATNIDALNILSTLDTWNAQYIYDCDVVHIYFVESANKWYVSTDQCIYASNKCRSSPNSVYEIYQEMPIDVDNLDKSICYTFSVINNKNTNIARCDIQGCVLMDTYGPSGSISIGNNLHNFTNIDNFISALNEIDERAKKDKCITIEGMMIKTNDIVCMVQTDLFRKISLMKNSTMNSYHLYLDLYKQDKAREMLPFFTKYSNDILYRMNIAMKTLSQELLDLYTITWRRNVQLHESLPESYQKILYNLNGKVMRKKRFRTNSYVLNVHDVYYHIKKMDLRDLITIFKDRNELLNNVFTIPYMVNCKHTLTQTRLM